VIWEEMGGARAATLAAATDQAGAAFHANRKRSGGVTRSHGCKLTGGTKDRRG